LIKNFVQEKTTKALFQASVILAGCFLIGTKDQGTFVYKEEMSAYELKFKIEAENEHTPITNIDCKNITKNSGICLLAQHKLKMLESYTDTSIAILKVIYTLLFICSAGFLFSFLLRPLMPT